MAVGSQSHWDLCFPAKPGAEGLEMQPRGAASSIIPKPAVFSKFCVVSQLMDSHQQDFVRNESWIILPAVVMPQVVGAEENGETFPGASSKPVPFNFFFHTK